MLPSADRPKSEPTDQGDWRAHYCGHGHYILIIKGNQPTARDSAAALLRGPDTDWVATTATEDDRGHGRVERRTIRVAPADDSLSPGAVQAFRLRRDTGGLDGVWTGKEIVYGVTSLPADPGQPLRTTPLGRGIPPALGPRRHLS